MAEQYEDRIITLLVTNSTITIPSSLGAKSISVLNVTTSTTNGTVNGGTTIGIFSSVDITLVPSSWRTYTSSDANHLVGMVITSPAATCTLEVTILV